MCWGLVTETKRPDRVEEGRGGSLGGRGQGTFGRREILSFLPGLVVTS